MFEILEHADGLCVMNKRAGMAFLKQFPKNVFPGVAERRMPDIMADSNRFNQIFIEPQATANRAGNAGDHLYVKRTARDMIVFNLEKDLSLIHVTRIGMRMNDPVGIMRKG